MISQAKDDTASPPTSQSVNTGTNEIQAIDVTGHRVKDDPNNPTLKRTRDGTLLVPQPTDDPDEPLVGLPDDAVCLVTSSLKLAPNTCKEICTN